MDNQITVLDKGFVRLVDSMGDDSSVVQAARVSYGEGTKGKEQDAKLINYLMKHRHTSPFEQVVFKFHVKLPIFVMRQLIRHRTASLNEISGRYTQLKNEAYVPDGIRYQSEDNKQGSSEEAWVDGASQDIAGEIKTTQGVLFEQYQGYIDQEVSRELARINLPLSTYTECYWTMDLHNLLHFLKLRLGKDSQLEITAYAEAILSLIEPIVPVSIDAWDNYVRYSTTFSLNERLAISAVMNEHLIEEVLHEANIYGLSKREVEQLREKLS